MASFAGIDYDSAGIYLVLIAEDDGRWLGHTHYDLEQRRSDSFERARLIRDLLPARGAWRDAGVAAIALEDLRSRQRAQVAAASRVEGALLACLPRDVEIVRLSVNRREAAGFTRPKPGFYRNER